MKNRSIKSITLILIIIISLGIIYGFYITRLQDAPHQETTSSNDLYNQTAIPTYFAPTQYSPIVILNSAHASSNRLRLNLTISDLASVANADDLENWVCNPNIKLNEPVSININYRDAKIPSVVGEPIEITYEYNIDASTYKSLTINLDLTIGPCADYLNAQESNVTPSLLPELVGNYHLSFQVPVQ